MQSRSGSIRPAGRPHQVSEKKKVSKKSAKPAEPVELDGSGVAWIAGTRVRVIEIVFDKLAHGGTVRDIKSRFPGLKLKQVQAGLDYFTQNQNQFEAEIQRRWEQVSGLGVREADSPFQRRLRELLGK